MAGGGAMFFFVCGGAAGRGAPAAAGFFQHCGRRASSKAAIPMKTNHTRAALAGRAASRAAARGERFRRMMPKHEPCPARSVFHGERVRFLIRRHFFLHIRACF